MYFAAFGRDERYQQELLEEIKARAVNGDQSAQKYMNEALIKSRLGQGNRPKEERFEELIPYMKRDLDINLLGLLCYLPSSYENFIFPVLHSLREGR